MSKIALVTGGIKGIGASISLALKAANYQVIANYVSNEEKAMEFSKKHGMTTKRWDVSDFEQCQKAITEIEQEFNGNIAILVNNAGITRDAMLHKMSYTQWSEVINTNLTSCFNMCHAVISKMREQQFGRIINISSVNGLMGQMGQVNYAAAKSGMIGFSKALAKESASKNITVNCIAPGYIDTEMVRAVPPIVLDSIIHQVPVRRLGNPDEIARAVVFLADENAGFITGETISINGGYYMS
jgi:acetoacetyl-CoA reductase